MRLAVRTTRLLICLFTLISLTAPCVPAQSGRRQKKAEPQPAVQGVNQPETRTQPEPVATADQPREKEKGPGILIMTGMTDAMIPLYFADTARQGCISELRNLLQGLQGLQGGHDIREARNQSRSEAIKAARDDDQYYVLWLEVEIDQMGTSMMGVDLRYTIFEPKTAKVVGIGSGYPSQPSSGSSMPPIGASRQQVYLDWAGRDVARQVVKRLGWRF
jgi:hypothetical protein